MTSLLLLPLETTALLSLIHSLSSLVKSERHLSFRPSDSLENRLIDPSDRASFSLLKGKIMDRGMSPNQYAHSFHVRDSEVINIFMVVSRF